MAVVLQPLPPEMLGCAYNTYRDAQSSLGSLPENDIVVEKKDLSASASSVGTIDSLSDLDIDRFDSGLITTMVREMAQHYKVPVAFVALEGPAFLELRSRHGITMQTTPLTSIARHWVFCDQPIVVCDTLMHPQLLSDALVVGPPVLQFYAAAPLKLGGSRCFGNLVIMDTVARTDFSTRDCECLARCAQTIMEMLEHSVGGSELHLHIPSLAALPSIASAGDDAGVGALRSRPSVLGSPKTWDCLPSMSLESFQGSRIVELVGQVAKHYGVSVAFLALETPTELRFRARHGICTDRAPLSSIARHWVSRALPIIVADATEKDRWRGDPLVVGPPARRFYASAPLLTEEMQCVGSLVIMDEAPRPAFALEHCELLFRCARAVMDIYIASSGSELWRLQLTSESRPPSWSTLPSMTDLPGMEQDDE